MKHGSAYKEATKKFQREFIRTALEQNGNNITQTAIEIGLDPAFLHKKCRALGLRGTK